MKADDIARMYLFGGNNRQVAEKSGISERTLYNRRKMPGKITLDELAGLVRANDLDKDDLFKLVTRRR